MSANTNANYKTGKLIHSDIYKCSRGFFKHKQYEGRIRNPNKRWGKTVNTKVYEKILLRREFEKNQVPWAPTRAEKRTGSLRTVLLYTWKAQTKVWASETQPKKFDAQTQPKHLTLKLSRNKWISILLELRLLNVRWRSNFCQTFGTSQKFFLQRFLRGMFRKATELEAKAIEVCIVDHLM